MSSDFDEGSFPKARGWLLAFSSSLIALWFFGADLTSVSVLGTKIEFTRNTEHVWLVALAINAYLLLRFYQHQPGLSYSGSTVFKNYYQGIMLGIMLWSNKRSIDKEVLERCRSETPSALEHGNIKCVIESWEFRRVIEPSEKRSLIRGMKEVVIIHAHCVATDKEGDGIQVTRTHEVHRICPYWLVFICIWLSKFKLWTKTSYATEHLLPYIWSGFAAVVCLLRWFAIVAS